MRATFVYCPTSGDRVFTESLTPYVFVVRYPNGCRHVAGGCHLQYWTAGPGNYWRSEAVGMASALVTAFRGGIAWDERGTIHVVVPTQDGKRADNMMLAAARAAYTSVSREDIEVNLASMVAAGWGVSFALDPAPFLPGHIRSATAPEVGHAPIVMRVDLESLRIECIQAPIAPDETDGDPIRGCVKYQVVFARQIGEPEESGEPGGDVVRWTTPATPEWWSGPMPDDGEGN